MKTDDQAWRELQNHASAQLRGGFADRVLRTAHGPQAETWQQLRDHGAAQLSPTFATRVLRAARGIQSRAPSLFGQFALGAATAAACLVAVVYVHGRSLRLEEERNLAGWQQLAADAQDLDLSR
jgi:hypothetical protein